MISLKIVCADCSTFDGSKIEGKVLDWWSLVTVTAATASEQRIWRDIDIRFNQTKLFASTIS